MTDKDEILEQFKEWPADLVAFKWADGLSPSEQDILRVGSLCRLQLAIDVAVKQAKESNQKRPRVKGKE